MTVRRAVEIRWARGLGSGLREQVHGGSVVDLPVATDARNAVGGAAQTDGYPPHLTVGIESEADGRPGADPIGVRATQKSMKPATTFPTTPAASGVP